MKMPDSVTEGAPSAARPYRLIESRSRKVKASGPCLTWMRSYRPPRTKPEPLKDSVPAVRTTNTAFSPAFSTVRKLS